MSARVADGGVVGRLESVQGAPWRVFNKRRLVPLGAVYVGRPTKWGNPFVIGRDGSRADVVAKYRAWLCDQPALMADLPSLRGRDLVCWCAPAACHADVLLELANDDALRARAALAAEGGV
jgi:hypothetical protein